MWILKITTIQPANQTRSITLNRKSVLNSTEKFCLSSEPYIITRIVAQIVVENAMQKENILQKTWKSFSPNVKRSIISNMWMVTKIEYMYHTINVADKFDIKAMLIIPYTIRGQHNDKEKLFSVLLFSTLLLADFLSIFYRV